MARFASRLSLSLSLSLPSAALSLPRSLGEFWVSGPVCSVGSIFPSYTSPFFLCTIKSDICTQTRVIYTFFTADVSITLIIGIYSTSN